MADPVAVLEQSIKPEQRAAVRSAVDALLTQAEKNTTLVEQLPTALHHIGDHPRQTVGDFSAGAFARTALEFLGNAQLKTGQKTLDPYWRNTAIEAGLSSANPQQMAANTKRVDDQVLTLLVAMNKGTMPTAPAMRVAVDATHTFVMRPVDGLVQGYEAVMETVSPTTGRMVPVRPINDIVKSQYATEKAIDAMLNGTSQATILQGFQTGIEWAKIDIAREHPELVKPAERPNQVTRNAEILQLLKNTDRLVAENQKDYDIFAKEGYLTKKEQEAHAEKQKKLAEAKESGDLDTIIEAQKEFFATDKQIAKRVRSTMGR